MSTQNANTTKQTKADKSKQAKADESKQIIEKYEKEINILDCRLKEATVNYLIEKFITTYKHIETNEDSDFDHFINSYILLCEKLCNKLGRYNFYQSDIIINYIKENFDHEVILHWVYRNVYKFVFEHYDDDYTDDLTTIFNDYDIQTIFRNVVLYDLIASYMESDDGFDLEIIQNYFPGFEYSGSENIHKIFWDYDFDDIVEYSGIIPWMKFINKYKCNLNMNLND